MSFSSFQTETATLSKIDTDYQGKETVSDSWTVNIDPVFGYRRVYTSDNEEITGQSTIITKSNLESIFDLTHKKWKLTYKSKDYNIERATPFYEIGTNNLGHLEVVLK